MKRTAFWLLGLAVVACALLQAWKLSRGATGSFALAGPVAAQAGAGKVPPFTGRTVHYRAPLPQWPNALALTTPIDPAKAARNIKPYDRAAQAFYLNWRPAFSNASGGVAGWNAPDNVVRAGSSGDGFYVASMSDPTYKLVCVHGKYCGYSDGADGIHIPNNARTQSSGAKSCDCHLYVVQPVGFIPRGGTPILFWPDVSPYQYEVDLENASNSADGAGSTDAALTTFNGGGVVYADGAALFSTGSSGWYGGFTTANDGFHPANSPPSGHWGGSANHGNSPYSATTVTAADFIQGAIKHEMFMNIVCAEKAQPDSWPSAVKDTDFSCAKLGSTGWSYGDHLWLQLSDAEIQSSSLSATQKVLATGLAHYGAVVLDTQNAWGPTFQINVNANDPGWSTVASMYSLQTTSSDGSDAFQLNMALPFPFLEHLHAINACVIRGTC